MIGYFSGKAKWRSTEAVGTPTPAKPVRACMRSRSFARLTNARLVAAWTALGGFDLTRRRARGVFHSQTV
jgi:hypothetical protein